MVTFVCSLWKKRCFLLLLPLILLCGCSSLGTSQASPTTTSAANQASSTATSAVNQASSTATSAANQASSTATSAASQASILATAAAKQAPVLATPAAQMVFTSYVGKWEVHGSLLAINANYTGLYQWNAGPCSSSQMCNGNAYITFTVNADGSIKGTIQSVSYTQWNGDPAPTGFQPDPTAVRAGDTFQLQHSGVHLLYTTWFGERLSSLNTANRYWCDSYALKAGWKQCGA